MRCFRLLCAVILGRFAFALPAQVVDMWPNDFSTLHRTTAYEIGQSFVAKEPQVSFGFYLVPVAGYEGRAESEISMVLYRGEDTVFAAPLLTRPALRTGLTRTLDEPQIVYSLYAANFSDIQLDRGKTYSVVLNTGNSSFWVPYLYTSTDNGSVGLVYPGGNAIMNGKVLKEGDYAIRLVQVPEPGTGAVFMAGVFLMGWFRTKGIKHEVV